VSKPFRIKLGLVGGGTVGRFRTNSLSFSENCLRLTANGVFLNQTHENSMRRVALAGAEPFMALSFEDGTVIRGWFKIEQMTSDYVSLYSVGAIDVAD